MALQSLDIVRRSATTTAPPGVRAAYTGTVATLIDTTNADGCNADQDRCIGCGYCIAGCPFDIPRISKRDHKAYKCTLCSDRVAVGLEPACIKACPTGALVFGTKEDMQQHAAERVEDLKSRGFERAGLSDPPRAGGTHVMYVLHHADRPELYAGLAAHPPISSLVGLWTGIAKPTAHAAQPS